MNLKEFIPIYRRYFSNTTVPIDMLSTSHSVLESATSPEINIDRRRFWNMLVTYIPKSKYIPANKNISILDIACGKCREGKVLNAFFGGNEYDQPSANIAVTGIDIREGLIAEARKENANTPLPLKLICGDVTQLNDYPEIPDIADIIVIRHQEMVNDKALWIKIFQESIARLQTQGLGIITSYTDHENKLAVDELSKLGLKIILSTRNEYANPTRFKDVSIDKNIILFKKKFKKI